MVLGIKTLTPSKKINYFFGTSAVLAFLFVTVGPSLIKFTYTTLSCHIIPKASTTKKYERN